MKCHKCNQDSIKIKTGHIYCDICGLDIDVGNSLEDGLYDLFIYNEQMDSAYKLGKEEYRNNKEYADNPYMGRTSKDQIGMKFKWWEGWTSEKNIDSIEALSLSSEKIENQLKTEIKELEEKYKELDKKIDTFLSENYELVTVHCSKLLCRKILGPILKKAILPFHRDIKILYKKTWNWSK